MKIKYINLRHSQDKNSRMQQMLNRHLLENIAERIDGVFSSEAIGKMSISETGCFKAHRSILMSLSEDESVLILEDDLSFCDNFGEKIKILVGRIQARSATRDND